MPYINFYFCDKCGKVLEITDTTIDHDNQTVTRMVAPCSACSLTQHAPDLAGLTQKFKMGFPPFFEKWAKG